MRKIRLTVEPEENREADEVADEIIEKLEEMESVHAVDFQVGFFGTSTRRNFSVERHFDRKKEELK